MAEGVVPVGSVTGEIAVGNPAVTKYSETVLSPAATAYINVLDNAIPEGLVPMIVFVTWKGAPFVWNESVVIVLPISLMK